MTTPEDTELREKPIKEKNMSNTRTVGEIVGQASMLFYNEETKLLDGVFDEKQAQEIVDKIEALIDLHTQKAELEVNGDTSDGYHTFNELYEYRMQYNAALFNEWALQKKYKVHKSWRHADNSTEPIFGGGWFIVMAELPTGQISNHYESHDWDKFQIPVTPTAHAFDGHTPQQALDRIAQLTNPTERSE